MRYIDKLNDSTLREVYSKFKPKGYAEKWGTLRWHFMPYFSPLLQLLTAICATAWPAYYITLMGGSWATGFLVAAFLLAVFEILKRVTLEPIAEDYYTAGGSSFFKKLGFKNSVLLLLLSVVSAGISYKGTPVLVEEFIAMPSPVADSINAKHDSTAAAATAFWAKAEKAAVAQANEIHQNNKARNEQGEVVTAYKVAHIETAFRQQAAAAADSLAQALARISARRDAELSASNKDLKAETATMQAKKEGFAAGLALLTLILDLSFIYCLFWVNRYDYEVFKELLKAQDKLLKVSKEAQKAEQKPVKVQQAMQRLRDAGQIASQPPVEEQLQPDQIIKDGSRWAIVCRKADGSLKPYEASKLTSMINQGGSRADYWKTQKDLLTTAIKNN